MSEQAPTIKATLRPKIEKFDSATGALVETVELPERQVELTVQEWQAMGGQLPAPQQGGN